jgi:hypothetical protein
MKYTPGIVTASMQEKIGSCSISVTSLDYATVLKGVDTEYLTVDNLVKLVDEKSTSTKSTQVVFGMTYDEASKKWTIADAKSFFKLVAGPCATADMPENYGVYIKPLLDALGNNSRDDFRNVCSGYEFLEFYSPVYTENDILVEYFKLCSIEVVKERVDAKKGEVVVDVKMTMPNLEAIDAKLLKDHDLVCELFELYITNLLDGNTPGNTMVKVMDIYKEPFIEALKAKDLPMTTVEGSFTLVKNGMIEADEMAFMVDVVPEKLLYKENIFMYIDDDRGAAWMKETIDKIVEEGLATRDQISAAFEKLRPES